MTLCMELRSDKDILEYMYALSNKKLSSSYVSIVVQTHRLAAKGGATITLILSGAAALTKTGRETIETAMHVYR